MSGSMKSESAAPSRARRPLQPSRFPAAPRESRIGSILTSSVGGALLILVLLSAFFSALRSHAFPRIANILNMATDASILLVLAVGGTFVILTGGIDLSINGVLVFSRRRRGDGHGGRGRRQHRRPACRSRRRNCSWRRRGAR